MADNPFEIPQAMRDLAEQNMKQAHAAYEQLMDCMTKAVRDWDALPSNPVAGEEAAAEALSVRENVLTQKESLELLRQMRAQVERLNEDFSARVHTAAARHADEIFEEVQLQEDRVAGECLADIRRNILEFREEIKHLREYLANKNL